MVKKAFELLKAAAICSGLIFVLNFDAAATETVVVSNQNHYISYETTADDKIVVFNMEATGDFTDEMIGKFPQGDFFSITVDANQNGAIDRNIDFSYGKRNERAGICVNYLINQNSSRPCGTFKSKAYLEISFRATKAQPKEHPVYRFTIPKGELKAATAGGAVHLVFTCYSANVGYTNYPAFDRKQFYLSLSETINIEL